MLRFEGDFGKVVLGQNSERGRVSQRYLELDVQSALYFYRRLAVVYPSLTNNSLGLFRRFG